MTMEQHKESIKAFLTRYFRNHELEDNKDIFAQGFVNSLFAMQLVLFVEQEFGIAIENDDLDFDNFRTINAIAQLVERKTVLQPTP